jgi:hypothetical protein
MSCAQGREDVAMYKYVEVGDVGTLSILAT